MSLWTRVPRGMRDRATGVLPDSWWVWLHQLREVAADRAWSGGAVLRQAYPGLVAEAAPLAALRRAELRVFSQNGEDGVIAYLLDRVGAESRALVEFGIGDGRECCAANLLVNFGWSGLLMDGDPRHASDARDFYASTLADPSRCTVLHHVAEVDNIDETLREHAPAEIDLLSVDIDGNDYWVWEAITSVRPRVVVIEYNATFGAERAATIPYTPGFDRYRAHASGFYHGASLAALALLADRKGYLLAGCESRGANAFFVDREAAAGRVADVAPADAFAPLYERVHLGLNEQFRRIAHLPLVDVGG